MITYHGGFIQNDSLTVIFSIYCIEIGDHKLIGAIFAVLTKIYWRDDHIKLEKGLDLSINLTYLRKTSLEEEQA